MGGRAADVNSFFKGAQGASNMLLQPYRRRALEAQANVNEAIAANGGGVYGTPIYGLDANGRPVLGAMDKQGGFRQVDTGGVTVTPGVRTIDTGTGTQIIDSRSGLPVRPDVQKDIAGATQQKGQGENLAEAQKALPVVEAGIKRMLRFVDDIEKSDYKSAVGTVQSRLPTFWSSTADAEANIEQAGGQGFLSMFENLKGAGAVTEAEGAKASAAFTRIGNLRQSDEGYTQALAAAKYEAFELYNTARKKAGLETIQNPFASGSKSSADAIPETPNFATQGGQTFREGQRAYNKQTRQWATMHNGQWVVE